MEGGEEESAGCSEREALGVADGVTRRDEVCRGTIENNATREGAESSSGQTEQLPAGSTNESTEGGGNEAPPPNLGAVVPNPNPNDGNSCNTEVRIQWTAPPQGWAGVGSREQPGSRGIMEPRSDFQTVFRMGCQSNPAMQTMPGNSGGESNTSTESRTSGSTTRATGFGGVFGSSSGSSSLRDPPSSSRRPPLGLQERRQDEDNNRRKRNRLDEQEAGGGFDSAGAGNALEALMEQVGAVLRSFPRGSTLKDEMEAASRKLNIEITKLLSRMVQKQEENGFLLQQIVQLQSMRTGEVRGQPTTYADAVRGGVAKEIMEGKRLPVAQIPATVRLSPAERTILVKSERKDGMASREKQQAFRSKLKEVVGDELASEVSAVRPTRYGGFTVVAASEAARDLVAERLVQCKVVPEERVVRPRRRTARMLCKTPPDVPPGEFIRYMHSRHNPELHKVPVGSRTAKINVMRLGWVFELSAAEAIACEAQGGKIRYSFGMEARLDEFIPLQQCYNCCNFGHLAKDCTAQRPRCRLCGKDGHCGRECPSKDNRTQWRCCNCREYNLHKGTKLSIDHAAAQMHVCAVATKEKDIRREQLRASGVFVSTRETGLTARSTVGTARPENMDVNSSGSNSGELEGARSAGRRPVARTPGHDGNTRQPREGPSRHENDELRSSLGTLTTGVGRGAERRNNGRVRWGDGDGEEEEPGSHGVGGGNRKGKLGLGGQDRSRRKGAGPDSRRRGGRRGGVRSDEVNLSTPGTTTVSINSEMEEDEFDF